MALTDELIDDLLSEWLYIAAGRTYEEHRPFARAIESAATAPLLEQIKLLESNLFQMQEAAKDLARQVAALEQQRLDEVGALYQELQNERRLSFRLRVEELQKEVLAAYDRGWNACQATHDGP